MKKKERQTDTKRALSILANCEFATLATINADNTPYCIPISVVLVDKHVYFHCATEGKKIDNILRNSSVCISCVGQTKLLPENFTTAYESTVVSGKCEIVEDETQKIMALKAISEKYASSNMASFEKTVRAWINRTTVCKISIIEITGKANDINN